MSDPITIHVGGLAVAASTVVRLTMGAGDYVTVSELSEAMRQVQRAAEQGAREGLLQMKRRGDPRLIH